MDYINDLHELCETISHEIAEANEKIRTSGGKLTAGDVDYIDKLTHTLKSLKTSIAMMEADGGSYADGSYGRYGYGAGSYRGGSYARGRGSYPMRSGRYSNGYSRDGGIVEELHALMDQAPNETIKRDIQRLAEKVEQQM